jgi:carbamoyltransferase-like protein
MLCVADVKDDKRDVITATSHVDGTGRLQTVSQATNPRYYQLIKQFGRATGVPVVLNTSFNLKGEPSVNTSAEALNTFCRSGIDVLVLDIACCTNLSEGEGETRPEGDRCSSGEGCLDDLVLPLSCYNASGSGSCGECC